MSPHEPSVDNELRIELQRLPGGVLHLVYDPKLELVVMSATSPAIGIIHLEVDRFNMLRIERWITRVLTKRIDEQ